MRKRRANSRVLGSFCLTFRSPLMIPRRICVTSCSRRGTSLLLESHNRIVGGEYHSQTKQGSKFQEEMNLLAPWPRPGDSQRSIDSQTVFERFRTETVGTVMSDHDRSPTALKYGANESPGHLAAVCACSGNWL